MPMQTIKFMNDASGWENVLATNLVATYSAMDQGECSPSILSAVHVGGKRGRALLVTTERTFLVKSHGNVLSTQKEQSVSL